MAHYLVPRDSCIISVKIYVCALSSSAGMFLVLVIHSKMVNAFFNVAQPPNQISRRAYNNNIETTPVGGKLIPRCCPITQLTNKGYNVVVDANMLDFASMVLMYA